MSDLIKKSNKDFGNKGEQIAKKYLLEKGLKLIESNFRYQRKEIDLIFTDNKKKILIFVEVKTRKTKTYGEPEESINFYKQKNIKIAAQGFLNKHHDYQNCDIRFDVLSVFFEKDNIIFNHIENAFY
jgi:putative endonuclease